MINVFRKIRKNLLDNKKFSKYLIYAIGEIILVVIGILIALQINNWNQNKIEEDALSGYLNSISKNIKEDIKNIDYLINKRVNAVSRIPFMTWTFINTEENLQRTDIKFASETLKVITHFDYFTSDLTGFESIKNSGFIRKLQGLDMENLIYKYYYLVEEIEKKEKDYNEIQRSVFSDFSSQGFENMVYVTYPDYIGDDSKLVNLQPSLIRIFSHPSALSLYNNTFYKAPELIVQYENLEIIGKEIVRLIDNDLKSFDNVSKKNLEKIYDVNSTEGYPKILMHGAENSAFFDYGYAAANDNPFALIRGMYEFTFEIPKTEWAVVYFKNPSNAFNERTGKDYSKFNTLKLELRGLEGGETVFIAIKDANDPDDGSESRVEIKLSKSWKTYEIPLSKFKTANLKKLFILASFIFIDEEQKISVRNIEYVQ